MEDQRSCLRCSWAGPFPGRPECPNCGELLYRLAPRPPRRDTPHPTRLRPHRQTETELVENQAEAMVAGDPNSSVSGWARWAAAGALIAIGVGAVVARPSPEISEPRVDGVAPASHVRIPASLHDTAGSSGAASLVFVANEEGRPDDSRLWQLSLRSGALMRGVRVPEAVQLTLDAERNRLLLLAADGRLLSLRALDSSAPVVLANLVSAYEVDRTGFITAVRAGGTELTGTRGHGTAVVVTRVPASRHLIRAPRFTHRIPGLARPSRAFVSDRRVFLTDGRAGRLTSLSIMAEEDPPRPRLRELEGFRLVDVGPGRRLLLTDRAGAPFTPYLGDGGRRPIPLMRRFRMDYPVAWSQDGELLAAVGTSDRGRGRRGLWLLATDGSAPRFIRGFAGDARVRGAFSPDAALFFWSEPGYIIAAETDTGIYQPVHLGRALPGELGAIALSSDPLTRPVP